MPFPSLTRSSRYNCFGKNPYNFSKSGLFKFLSLESRLIDDFSDMEWVVWVSYECIFEIPFYCLIFSSYNVVKVQKQWNRRRWPKLAISDQQRNKLCPIMAERLGIYTKQIRRIYHRWSHTWAWGKASADGEKRIYNNESENACTSEDFGKVLEQHS